MLTFHAIALPLIKQVNCHLAITYDYRQGGYLTQAL
jgi:hypothetical protein